MIDNEPADLMVLLSEEIDKVDAEGLAPSPPTSSILGDTVLYGAAQGYSSEVTAIVDRYLSAGTPDRELENAMLRGADLGMQRRQVSSDEKNVLDDFYAALDRIPNADDPLKILVAKKYAQSAKDEHVAPESALGDPIEIANRRTAADELAETVSMIQLGRISPHDTRLAARQIGGLIHSSQVDADLSLRAIEVASKSAEQLAKESERSGLLAAGLPRPTAPVANFWTELLKELADELADREFGTDERS